MRAIDPVSTAAGQQQHSKAKHHHLNSGPGAPASAGVMSSTLSEQPIFAPGALVEVQTIHKETIIGEVLAFAYDSKLLILSKYH